tara:strand:- start:574 stop:1125 length:552 start_codon:yes stop_codon:yes gene_type:complete
MFFIYRLTDGEQDYYGQTENPKRRFGEHKAPSCRCRSKLLDKSKMKLHIIFRLYTQEEADETEAFYQLNFECVNKLITGRTKQEYLEVNKEKKQEYNKKHREENKEHYKEYRETNKEHILEKNKKWREENKEKIAEKRKAYNNNNKEKRAEKFYCDCGSVITIVSKTRHLKTKKHQNYISSIK